MNDLRSFVIETIDMYLDDLIIESAVKKEFIYVDEYLRGIGKTTAIVKFANRAKVALVVPSSAQENYIKQTFDMRVPVVSQHNVNKLRGTNWILVFDEGVDPKNLSGFKVVTGFLNY